MVALSGAANGSTIADGSGNYTFAALANGTYTVTPTKYRIYIQPCQRERDGQRSQCYWCEFHGQPPGDAHGWAILDCEYVGGCRV